MFLRRLPLLAALLVLASVPFGCADEVEIDTRPCGLQSPGRCSYGGGCHRFCSDDAGCLCVSIEKAPCGADCSSGCVPTRNMPLDDAADPWRHVCRAAIDQSLAERAQASQ